MSRIKKRKLVFMFVIFILVSFVIIDRELFLWERVRNGLWEYDRGLYIGEYLSNDKFKVDNGYLVINKEKRYLIIGAFCGKLVLYDKKKNEFGLYERFKGSRLWH